jgi:2-polyprenyl-6-methoxyphenol hydroxylase-like FAD-dependent oxidoreductase
MATPRTPAAPAPSPRLGEHAIVIGASMAGLLAASALADSYDRVTVLDRDRLPDGLTENRRAVPQGLHAHGLQPGGQLALESLLPGLRDEALAAGALPLNAALDMRMNVGGNDIRRVAVDGEYAVASRPMLEGLVRRRVRAIENVTIHDNTAVSGLISEGDRVVGVIASERAPRGEERALRADPTPGERSLRADLVVAATGRGGKVPAWLAALGYERPVEERIGVDVVYASRHLRRRPGSFGDDRLVLSGATPQRPRCMALVAEEDGRWNLTLQGYGEEHRPPTDDAGFLAFLATVAEPDVLAELARSEPLSKVSTYCFPASLRRRYDKLKRFPDGLLVMGDALCSFNPIYGQGMAVAALEAVALRRCLQAGDRRLTKRFFKAMKAPVEHAWKLAGGSDLEMPGVDGTPALPDRIVGRYMNRLLAVAAHDDEVARTFVEVMGMLAPPTSILRPAIARRVLRRGATRRPALATVHALPVAAEPAAEAAA